MRVWGGVLPFFGFTDLEIPIEYAAMIGLGVCRLAPGSMTHVEVEVLALEWLNRGVFFMVRPKR